MLKTKLMIICVLVAVLAIGSVAQATPIASNTENDVYLYATIAGGTSFDSLQQETDYTVNITCSHDITYFGYEWDVIGGGFVLEQQGDVIFTALPTYGVTNWGYGPLEYTNPSPTLSGDSKEISGVSIEAWDAYMGEYFAAGDTIMSLSIQTGAPGVSSLAIGADTAIDWTPPGSYPIPCFDSSTPAAITVVPEPATICLLGLGGLLLRRRKRS